MVFLVAEGQVFDVVLAGEQLVEQGNQQFLAGRLPEENLETEIRERVHKFSHDGFVVF